MLKSIFQVAADCGTDWQTARDLVETGAMPPPVYVGAFARWRQSDITDWATLGCPKANELTEEGADAMADALLHELKTLDERN